jgi:glycosyltransferase involved in cell wall biosynthesis
MRILVVSQMYPGPRDPDLGAFVAQIVGELRARGHEVDLAVVDHRAGSRAKHARLVAAALGEAIRTRPDVVYGHFLFPAGAAAALASLVARAPAVLTAHGRDVRNIGAIPGVAAATRFATRRAAAVIAVSDYLRRELEQRLPQTAAKTTVIDSGVDLDRFHGADQQQARVELGWAERSEDGPRFLFVGGLDERKNVRRLVEAFARLEHGSLALVGDGPLRAELEGRDGVTLVGRIPHAAVARWIVACDVLCLPSLIEPFGQALLEGMASERTVLATRVGGPPEFVPDDAGVLVDPLSVDDIEAGLRRAANYPSPNPGARAAAAQHALPRQVDRILAVLERARRAGGAAP